MKTMCFRSNGATFLHACHVPSMYALTCTRTKCPWSKDLDQAIRSATRRRWALVFGRARGPSTHGFTRLQRFSLVQPVYEPTSRSPYGTRRIDSAARRPLINIQPRLELDLGFIVLFSHRYNFASARRVGLPPCQIHSGTPTFSSSSCAQFIIRNFSCNSPLFLPVLRLLART